jgi:hypothetical protein
VPFDAPRTFLRVIWSRATIAEAYFDRGGRLLYDMKDREGALFIRCFDGLSWRGTLMRL